MVGLDRLLKGGEAHRKRLQQKMRAAREKTGTVRGKGFQKKISKNRSRAKGRGTGETLIRKKTHLQHLGSLNILYQYVLETT